jgi:KipI family sensor histidine kinase inhibitor
MVTRLAGDSMVIVEIEPAIDPVVNERAIELGERIARRGVAGVRDIVPGYCTVGVHFDPLRTDLAALEQAIEDEGRVVERVETLPPRDIVEIPAAYGGADGPDLQAVADISGLSPDEVVAIHSSVTYRVYMLGFVPGFTYMGRVDPRIVAPRHRVPRERVEAGSIGIAGKQTGVYPIATPGGWQIVARTTVKMFDPDRQPASLLKPGDLVRFVPT